MSPARGRARPVALAALAAGVALAGAAGHRALTGGAGPALVPVRARVLRSEVHPEPVSFEQGRAPRFFPYVEFVHEDGGAKIVESTAEAAPLFDDEAAAQAVADRFPVGADVIAWRPPPGTSPPGPAGLPALEDRAVLWPPVPATSKGALAAAAAGVALALAAAVALALTRR